MHTSRTVEVAARFALIALVVIVALVSTQYDIQQHHRQTQRDLQLATSRLYDSVPTVAGCQRRFYHCRDGAVNTGVFWKLQRLVVPYEGLHYNHLRVPEVISHPSPMVLFTGWLLAALAITTFYHIGKRDRSQNIFIVGSILAAMAIGGVDCTSVNSIVLTNIPWCISLGLIVSVAARQVPGWDALEVEEISDKAIFDSKVCNVEKG